MCRPASPPLPERPKEGLPGAPAARGDEVPELGGRGGLPTERWRSSAAVRSASTLARDASSSAIFSCKNKDKPLCARAIVKGEGNLMEIDKRVQ